MRKHYSTTFKAEAVKELLKEEKTISQLAAEIGVHPTQLKEWKKIALQGLPDLFSRDAKVSEQSKAHEQHVNELVSVHGLVMVESKGSKEGGEVAELAA